MIACTIKSGERGVVITTSDGKPVECYSAMDILDEYYYSSPDTMRVCWNLDDTIAPLIKAMGLEFCKALYKTHKGFMRPYSIFYIPDKVFMIKAVHKQITVKLYGIDKYFPNDDEPDINEVNTKGSKLVETLIKMGMTPNKLTSPVAIWEDNVLNHASLPTGWDMPYQAAEYAWQCSGRLWTEAIQLGYWNKTYDYDIRSAFPSVAREMVGFSKSDWIETNRYCADAVYGYCKAEVVIYDEVIISPIIYADTDGSLSTPVGAWETYLTKGELDFITKWGIGEYRIINGWWAVPLKHKKPFRVLVDRLLQYKESDDELIRWIAKQMAVGGTYGKFGEEHGDTFGRHFNPCWFSEISTQTRLEVADFIYRNTLQDNVLHISIDGILTNKKVDEPMTDRTGCWRLSSETPALIVSSGMVYLKQRKPKGLYLEQVLEMIKEHPRKGYYEQAIPRVVTLGDAMRLGRLDDIGKTKMMYSTIDLYRIKRERLFRGFPMQGDHLLNKHYKSKPRKIFC